MCRYRQCYQKHVCKFANAFGKAPPLTQCMRQASMPPFLLCKILRFCLLLSCTTRSRVESTCSHKSLLESRSKLECLIWSVSLIFLLVKSLWRARWQIKVGRSWLQGCKDARMRGRLERSDVLMLTEEWRARAWKMFVEQTKVGISGTYYKQASFIISNTYGQYEMDFHSTATWDLAGLSRLAHKRAMFREWLVRLSYCCEVEDTFLPWSQLSARETIKLRRRASSIPIFSLFQLFAFSSSSTSSSRSILIDSINITCNAIFRRLFAVQTCLSKLILSARIDM